VFPQFPTRRTLLADLVRAGVERKDTLGRTLHLRSFRKTWQTLGVRYGINQRSAQAVLGHSDPSLTANVYTDVPALGLHDEIAKLPWLGNDALGHSLKSAVTRSISDLVAELVERVRVLGPEAFSEGKKTSENWSGR
jgi:integrase